MESVSVDEVRLPAAELGAFDYRSINELPRRPPQEQPPPPPPATEPPSWSSRPFARFHNHRNVCLRVLARLFALGSGSAPPPSRRRGTGRLQLAVVLAAMVLVAMPLLWTSFHLVKYPDLRIALEACRNASRMAGGKTGIPEYEYSDIDNVDLGDDDDTLTTTTPQAAAATTTFDK